MDPIILIGAIVNPWGKVIAVGMIEGERHYWLADKHGSVSMMPGNEVERAALTAKEE